jgi:hypothetical protein
MEEAERHSPVVESSEIGGVYELRDGTKISYAFYLVDGRFVVDDPWGQHPPADHPETRVFIAKNSGAHYCPERAFVHDPSFQIGPPLVEIEQDRYVIKGGHGRTNLYRVNRAAYEKALPHWEARYGFSGNPHPDWRQPYMVAVIKAPLTDVQRARLIAQLNETSEQPINRSYDAIRASQRLSVETLKEAGVLFSMHADETPIRTLLRKSARTLSRAFVHDGAIRSPDVLIHVRPAGGFTEQGAYYARLALLAGFVRLPETLEALRNTQTEHKLLNALGCLVALAYRGQNMEPFTEMIRLEVDRTAERQSVGNYQKNYALRSRPLAAFALQRWFAGLSPRRIRRRFEWLLATFCPNETSQVDAFRQANRDVIDGLMEYEQRVFSSDEQSWRGSADKRKTKTAS